ncbi:hypothetical protein [Micromonospora tarensis]|uniref:Uncharacterized protein n=1 Tax=Micromonospora tarensis TaxID=2806100 RepID=A0ABS1YPQ9_9ACTN|nr:hypothetical protein [Micromonospora tarensis]MBM0279437.1 hypothetical protein [Micromonospora tarensis]
MRWMIVDAPLDSSGTGRGEERAPAALRRAGLRDALAADDDGRSTRPGCAIRPGSRRAG